MLRTHPRGSSCVYLQQLGLGLKLVGLCIPYTSHTMYSMYTSYLYRYRRSSIYAEIPNYLLTIIVFCLPPRTPQSHRSLPDSCSLGKCTGIRYTEIFLFGIFGFTGNASFEVHILFFSIFVTCFASYRL